MIKTTTEGVSTKKDSRNKMTNGFPTLRLVAVSVASHCSAGSGEEMSGNFSGIRGYLGDILGHLRFSGWRRNTPPKGARK